MKFEIKVPSVGESVSSADIESWEKQSGDWVKKGDILVVLETDKASMEVPAEKEGALSILKSKGEAAVGEVIGFIDTAAAGKQPSQAPPSKKEKSPAEQTGGAEIPSAGLDRKKADSFQNTEDSLSPAVRRLIETSLLQPSQIKGTGRGGRLTKEDVLKALDAAAKEPPGAGAKAAAQSSGALSQNKSPSLHQGQRREAMTRLRKATAQRLVRSQHSTASLSTFNEVDLSRIIEIRKKYQESFVKKHGCKLGFMSFFVKAAVSALKEFPRINAFIEGNDIVYNDHQHIGIAVSSEKGLVVPVIFHAESLSLAEIEKKILEFRDKALSRKLSPDDLMGGTFTISNGGVFGSLLSTPILNPPQSGILGMHKIEPRPIARNGKMEIRPMMYLALSYDHRIVDGRESVGFLVKIKEILEEPARLLIDM